MFHFDFNKENVIATWTQVYAYTDVKITTFIDFDAKRVGLLKGDINSDNFIKLYKNFGISPQIIWTDSLDDQLKLLSEGRIDAIATDRLSIMLEDSPIKKTAPRLLDWISSGPASQYWPCAELTRVLTSASIGSICDSA